MPTGILAHFIVIHAQFGFGLLETLLNRPAQTTEPQQGLQPFARRGVSKEVAVLGIISKCSSDQQPHGLLQEPGTGEDNPPACELINDRPLGAFRDRATVPEIVVDNRTTII